MAGFTFDGKEYPTGPGCYLMKDDAGQVLYVGKAVNLRHRLASYFAERQSGRRHGRIRRLASQVASIDVIVVHNETESLILENNLIKRHQPPFNQLKKEAGTGYYYIVLTDEALPRLLPFRKARFNSGLLSPDGHLVPVEHRFGPYLQWRVCHRLLDLVADRYGLRTCHPMPRHACLRVHLGRCSAVCEGQVSAADYRAAVDRAVACLSQKPADLAADMRQEMMACAGRLEFERAQYLKEKIEALERAIEPQVVERDVSDDEDVVYLGDEAVVVACIEHGALQSVRTFPLPGGNGQAARERLLADHYAAHAAAAVGSDLARIIVNAPDGLAALETVLAATGQQVTITLPWHDDHHRLIDLCALNYAHHTRQS